MGSAASMAKGLDAAAKAASPEALKAALDGLDAEQRKKLLDALASVEGSSSKSTDMPAIGGTGVKFDTIAREWRGKWTKDNDMSSLKEANEALKAVLGTIKAVEGVRSVRRIVCGDCLDFKVIISMEHDKFDPEKLPEKDFLKTLGEIKGFDKIETQTYTFMEM